MSNLVKNNRQNNFQFVDILPFEGRANRKIIIQDIIDS